MADFKATDLKLYAKATAPSPGDISTQYTAVGYITDLNISQSRGAIETSSKDDGDESSFIGGRRNWTLDVSCVYDKESDAGQLIFSTAMASTTASVYFLVSSNTSGDVEWYGAGVITSLTISAPDNDVVTLSATVQGTGALTEQIAASTT